MLLTSNICSPQFLVDPIRFDNDASCFFDFITTGGNLLRQVFDEMLAFVKEGDEDQPFERENLDLEEPLFSKATD